MLYPKKEEPFQESLFRSPTSEYRGAPFWAWNCAMTEEMVDATIRDLREMGMGGAHIHPRTGLDTPYLSDEFMALVKRAVAAGKENGMLTWLYDEDRWPSGYGGGLVTSDHAYRNRYLVFAPYRLDQCETNTIYISSAMPARSKERTLLGRYGVFIERGCLEDYCLLQKEEELPEGWQEWFAYLEVSGDSPWFNNQAYVNTLDQRAVEKFIEVTHERYYQTAGDEFGKSIPAIFTDEPQFCHKDHLGFAEESREVIIPFTDDFDDTFIEAYGYSLMEKLPELFWELPKGRVSVSRYRYHDHLCERFVRAYADTIGAWCREHKILLTGHMMEEPTLMSQTAALGEAMRSYRGFDLPGIDMLCDWRELSTAKQAQSAARQNGSVGVLSEIYGVTNWDFDFRGHKLAGDWQAVLGVTVRVHHLNWTTMAGEAKRDYPAPIGYQSPWYRQYRLVEDHFARLNTVLTRGKAIAKIGVIHPIESYWLYFGTEEMTGGIRREMEDDFNTLIEWLLFGLQDFDFIAESLLPIPTDLRLQAALRR